MWGTRVIDRGGVTGMNQTVGPPAGRPGVRPDCGPANRPATCPPSRYVCQNPVRFIPSSSPLHVASGRCVLSAAADSAPAGVVSAFTQPCGWCVGAVLDVTPPPAPTPPKELWAITRVHKRQSAQKRRKKIWLVSGLQDQRSLSVTRMRHEDACGHAAEQAMDGKIAAARHRPAPLLISLDPTVN